MKLVELKKLLFFYITQLVDKPHKVTIQEVATEKKKFLEVKVAGKDLPAVIGKEGRIFRALRSLANSVQSSEKIDIVIDVAV